MAKKTKTDTKTATASRQTVIDLLSGGSNPFLTKKATADAVSAVLDAIMNAATKNGGLRIAGFGSFKLQSRKARSGRNPHTGQSIEIAAKTVIKFKAAKEFSDRI